MNRTGSMLCPVILGRDDLLGLMDELIAEALNGRGRTLLLSGQAGLGKTRLIRATIRKAESSGLRVDGGSVAPQDLQVPLASIREMATGMRGNPAWGTLSEDLLATDGSSAGDALAARRLIVRSAADRILDAIDRPTMLVFDDLHWADEMSSRSSASSPGMQPSGRCSCSAAIALMNSRQTRSIASGDRAS